MMWLSCLLCFVLFCFVSVLSLSFDSPSCPTLPESGTGLVFPVSCLFCFVLFPFLVGCALWRERGRCPLYHSWARADGGFFFRGFLRLVLILLFTAAVLLVFPALYHTIKGGSMVRLHVYLSLCFYSPVFLLSCLFLSLYMCLHGHHCINRTCVYYRQAVLAVIGHRHASEHFEYSILP